MSRNNSMCRDSLNINEQHLPVNIDKNAITNRLMQVHNNYQLDFENLKISKRSIGQDNSTDMSRRKLVEIMTLLMEKIERESIRIQKVLTLIKSSKQVTNDILSKYDAIILKNQKLSVHIENVLASTPIFQLTRKETEEIIDYFSSNKPAQKFESPSSVNRSQNRYKVEEGSPINASEDDIRTSRAEGDTTRRFLDLEYDSHRTKHYENTPAFSNSKIHPKENEIDTSRGFPSNHDLWASIKSKQNYKSKKQEFESRKESTSSEPDVEQHSTVKKHNRRSSQTMGSSIKSQEDLIENLYTGIMEKIEKKLNEEIPILKDIKAQNQTLQIKSDQYARDIAELFEKVNNINSKINNIKVENHNIKQDLSTLKNISAERSLNESVEKKKKLTVSSRNSPIRRY